MRRFAQDAIEVLYALGVKEKAIFVGHSMGGVVTKGDRTKGPVILGPPLPSPTVKKTFERRGEGGRRKCVALCGEVFLDLRQQM